jgi:hypothetical protein
LSFSSKQHERYIFTAQQGILHRDMLYLTNGSIHTISSDKQYSALFKQSEINIARLLGIEKSELQLKQVKFLSWPELKPLVAQGNQDACCELYKRLAQIIWLLFIPFLVLGGIWTFGAHQSNILFNIIMTGILFLISYLSLGLSSAWWHVAFLGFIILAGSLMGAFTVILLFLRKFL